VTSPQGNPARREPLLWLQLLGLAALPLEAAALLLVLAGADPGPLPGLERVFCWALGAVGPAVLLWRLPPDLWSLLLLQVPLKGRRPDQLRLSALQGSLPLRLLAAAGAPLLLPLLWWSDSAAGLAWAWSPLSSSPRLVVLLVAAALLALMLWQWQQIVQALWLFSRPATQVAQTLPLPAGEAADRRLNLGLPLLLLAPLEPTAVAAEPVAEVAAEPVAENAAVPVAEPPSEPAAEPEEDEEETAAAEMSQQPCSDNSPASEAAPRPDSVPTSVQTVQNPGHSPEAAPVPDSVSAAGVDSGIDGGVAIAPEQGAEQAEGDDLDQQV